MFRVRGWIKVWILQKAVIITNKIELASTQDDNTRDITKLLSGIKSFFNDDVYSSSLNTLTVNI